MAKYTGKFAVITGGTSGIGLAIAKLLVSEGARVLLTGRTQKTLDEARREFTDKAIVVQSDVASLPDMEALARQVETDFKPVDALFVNAGQTRFAPFEVMGEDAYDELFAVNAKGGILYSPEARACDAGGWRRRIHDFRRECTGIPDGQRICRDKSRGTVHDAQSGARASAAWSPGQRGQPGPDQNCGSEPRHAGGRHCRNVCTDARGEPDETGWQSGGSRRRGCFSCVRGDLHNRSGAACRWGRVSTVKIHTL